MVMVAVTTTALAKFVPARAGGLSSGQLYGLRLVQDLGDRTGWGEWVALDRDQVQINADAAAAMGGTGRSQSRGLRTSTSRRQRGSSA